MTIAALALAVAVVIVPTSSRRRAQLLMGLARRRRQLRVAPLAVIACAALPWLMPSTTAVGLGLLAATLIARRRFGVRRQARIGEAVALQAAMDVMVGELRAGAHPVAAIAVAAEESHGRVAEALRSVSARAVLGADVAAGLRVQGQRSSSPGHWERLAVCWHLAQKHGLAIATLMQAAQRDIVERQRFQGRVSAGMAGARATATILAGLPLLGVLLGQSVGADPLHFLLSGGAGGWLFVLGTGLICCGLLWSDGITSRAVT